MRRQSGTSGETDPTHKEADEESSKDSRDLSVLLVCMGHVEVACDSTIRQMKARLWEDERVRSRATGLSYCVREQGRSGRILNTTDCADERTGRGNSHLQGRRGGRPMLRRGAGITVK